MDEEKKNRIHKALAEYFVKKHFITMGSINFKPQFIVKKEDEWDLDQIWKKVGVSKKELEEFAQLLIQQDIDRFNFKNR